MSPITRADCVALDAADALAPLPDQSHCAIGLICLDGNSLGVLPRATPGRLGRIVKTEWVRDLIRNWNDAGWIDRPQIVGDKIARLVGAGPGDLIVADSTTLNLYKVLGVGLQKAAVLVSGVFELSPPIGTSIDDELRMTGDEAASIALQRQDLAGFPPAVVCRGAIETESFKRQSREFAASLRDSGTPVSAFEVPGRNHFDVILELCSRDTAAGRRHPAAARLSRANGAASAPGPSVGR